MASHGMGRDTDTGRGPEQSSKTTKVSPLVLFYTYSGKNIFVSTTVKRFRSKRLP